MSALQAASGVIEGILGRLARLEQQASSSASETLSANYLTIDPVTGLVSAIFSGLVKALGLVLPAAASAESVTDANRVVWVRSPDQQVALLISGYTLPDETAVMVIQASAVDSGNDLAAIVIAGNTPAGSGQTSIELTAGAAMRIKALDDTGASDFLQAAKGLAELGNTTGVGAAALGGNCPATTLGQPYTWLQATAADGSPVYIPAWK